MPCFHDAPLREHHYLLRAGGVSDRYVVCGSEGGRRQHGVS